MAQAEWRPAVLEAQPFQTMRKGAQRCLLGHIVDPMNAPDTRCAVFDDAEVAYQVIGDGPLDLVYHHGLHTSIFSGTPSPSLPSTASSPPSTG
jgi:hypothetical protein